MGPAAPDDDDGGGGGCGGGAEPGEEDEAPDDDDDVLEGGVVAEATQPPASSRSWSNSNEVLGVGALYTSPMAESKLMQERLELALQCRDREGPA